MTVPRPCRMLAARLIIPCLALGLIALARASHAQPATPSDQLPKYKEMVLPSGEDLLRNKPFDWIVLKTDDVLVVEPISPRPDPLARFSLRQKNAETTYNRILRYRPARVAEVEQKLNRNRDLNVDALRGEIEAKLTAARDKIQEQKAASQKLTVTLLDDSVDPDFLLDTRHIALIVHYEELVLRRAEQLIAEGRVPLAYDLLLLVNRRHKENNARIQAEIEADEKVLLTELDGLKARREELRKERDDLKTKPRTGPNKQRETELENSIDSHSKEIKDLEDELQAVRKKLRFVRPKDFPKPEGPLKDDILLPSWPRFDDIYVRLVVKDAELHAARNDFENALRLLEEIWKPDGSVADLSEKLGSVTESLIAAQLERGDYRQARYFLNRLSTREPNHSVVQKWKSELSNRAAQQIAEARELASRGEVASATEVIDRAARIWPDAAGLRDAHREVTGQFQRLKVAVLTMPGERSRYSFPVEADIREELLTTLRQFEPARIDELGVRYRSQILETWEPTDLGRKVKFTLRMKRADWESRPLVTSNDVVADLSIRLDPNRAEFDQRLAGFVSGISVQSPSEFTVSFHRLPLRLESIWSFPVGGQPEPPLEGAGSDSEMPSSASSQRFVRISRGERTSVYRRTHPQSRTSRDRRIDEIVEQRYDSWESALQGLLRGDVAAISRADLRDLKDLQDDGRFFVVPLALPWSHFLMFHPSNAALRDGQLRRALLHAIPRERLLNGIVLKDASSTHGRLVTSPFASRSYGNNRQLEQPIHDLQMAAALALAAKKRAGDSLPSLRLICPADPTIREVAREMIGNWKRVGVDVVLLEETLDESQVADNGWDICYRTARFAEPVMDIWPLLTMRTDASVAALQPLPERTRRTLLEIERTIDWTTATKQLHRLLADQLTEARYIPLWEVDEFFVARKNVIGIPQRPLHTYDEVERWSLQSWYPTDVP